MKVFGDLYKSEKKKNKKSTFSKEQIINQAIQCHLQGNISQAAKLYQFIITQGFCDHRVFSNYGGILKGLGKLKEAEISTRRAIELNPDLEIAHSNLGNILRNLGNLKEAEISTRRAINLKPDFVEAYSNLGSILRALGKLEDAKICSDKIMSIRPWSILGSYSFNQRELD